MSYRRIYKYFRHYLIASFSTVLLLASVLGPQIQFADASSKSPYDSGYDHGCDDAGISDPSDRYINEPGKGPNFHTDEFMQRYNAGYNACSNEDGNGSGSSQTRGINWMPICTFFQSALYSSCNSLVNYDGTLTIKGDRAFTCIRNGALLAAGAGLNSIPPHFITEVLRALEGPTGCGGIVNWNTIDAIVSVNRILNLIPLP